MRPIGLAERFQALMAANYGTFRGFVRAALAHDLSVLVDLYGC